MTDGSYVWAADHSSCTATRSCRRDGCDAAETEAAWYSAVTSKEHPTVLVLSRQNLAPMGGAPKAALKGGYIIKDCEGTPESFNYHNHQIFSKKIKEKSENDLIEYNT